MANNKHCLFYKKVVLIIQKRVFLYGIAAILLLQMAVLPAAAEEAPPQISAAAAVLLEAESGRILYADNADMQMCIASTTKIMTALVVLESADPEELVEIKPEYTNIEGSSIYLRAGEKLTVRTLLYGMLLESGNDAAVALACHVAGSVDAFADQMNEKVRTLGLKNTSFRNPNGLDEEGHYSSAGDLAQIMAAAMRNETFAELVSTRSITVGERTFSNHNKLLWNCDGVVGGKTGYTKQAGRTLVSCAERDGMQMICVTLNDPADWKDHSALYDWGYDCYRFVELLSREEEYCRLPVISGTAETVGVCAAEDVRALLSTEQTAEMTVDLPRFVYADISIGGTAGYVTVSVDGAPVKKIRLIYTENVPQNADIRLSFWEQVKRGLRMSVKYGYPYGYGYGGY